jgi:hypothetical protein
MPKSALKFQRIFTIHTASLCTLSHAASPIVSRIDHAIVSVVHRKIRIARPRRERMRFATPASHSKGENEHHDLSTAIHRRGDKVVVLDEQRGMVLADVKLTDESHDEEHRQRAVDADEQVAHVPEDDGRVDVSPLLVTGQAVGDVGWDWYDKANEEGESNPFVARADAEHFAGDTPGDGESVELLDVLAGPDVAALD